MYSNLSLSNPALENLDVFKRYRNADNRIIRAAKTFFFETVPYVKYSIKPQKTSKLLQSAINKKVVVNSTLIPKLDVNGKLPPFSTRFSPQCKEKLLKTCS
jgi:hypothetical protein